MALPRICVRTIVFGTKNGPNILLTLTFSSAKLLENSSTIEETFTLHKTSQITVENFEVHTYSTNRRPPKTYTWMYNVLGDGTGARPEAANQMPVWFLQEVLTPFLQPMRRMLTFPPLEGLVQWKVLPYGLQITELEKGSRKLCNGSTWVALWHLCVCLILDRLWSWLSRGGSRIPRRRGHQPSRRGAPTYKFARFSQKTAWN